MSANAKKKDAAKETPKANIHKAVDFKSIYVNYIQTASSASDISIGIGETSPTPTGIVDVEMKARLVVAPLQAKIMLGMLFQVIQQYENKFGVIAIPPVVAEQLAAAVRGISALESHNDSTEGV